MKKKRAKKKPSENPSHFLHPWTIDNNVRAERDKMVSAPFPTPLRLNAIKWIDPTTISSASNWNEKYPQSSRLLHNKNKKKKPDCILILFIFHFSNENECVASPQPEVCSNSDIKSHKRAKYNNKYKTKTQRCMEIVGKMCVGAGKRDSR